jgi:hypothetical protein
MGRVIAVLTVLLLMNYSIGSVGVDSAVELGIITTNEAELIVNGVEDGTMDVMNVNSDEGIMTFAVIYYDDTDEYIENVPVPCVQNK